MSRAHHWSDWAGFAVFTLLWAGVLQASPALGIMTAPLVLHPLLSSAGFLLRKPLVSSAPGLLPRLAAYCGTFGVLACVKAFEFWRPQWLAPATDIRMRDLGFALWAVGAACDLWAVWSLRHGMSIVPQARTLITSGAYRYARHPLYAAYILQNLGLWFRFQTFPVAMVVLGWFLLSLLRIRFEERVLEQNFPQYKMYRQHVGAFFPAASFQLSAVSRQLLAFRFWS
jgi:protein-S-isoprenylcysteine O-methyltransferase Ste14